MTEPYLSVYFSGKIPETPSLTWRIMLLCLATRWMSLGLMVGRRTILVQLHCVKYKVWWKGNYGWRTLLACTEPWSQPNNIPLRWIRVHISSQAFLSNISVWSHKYTSGIMGKNSHKNQTRKTCVKPSQKSLSCSGCKCWAGITQPYGWRMYVTQVQSFEGKWLNSFGNRGFLLPTN